MDSFPEETVFEFMPVEGIRSPILKAGFHHWNAIRGARRFPSRQKLRLRAVASVMAHMVLVRVLDGGGDFEFRFVGDTATRSFKVPRLNRTLCEIAQEEPHQAMRLAALYRCCVDGKAPIAVRGTIGHDATAANFTHVEAVVMPLGPSDDEIDHLLGFGVYEKRLGKA